MKPITSTGAPIVNCSEEDRCTPLTCGVCMAEIPQTVGLTFDGPDYVAYFCGLDCLEAWKKSHPTQAPDPKGKK